MPRLIFKCPYIKGGTSSATAHLENYVKYMATRNGVERIDPGRSGWPATSKQKKMVEQILRDFPLIRGMFEYEDYAAEPTRANASEFITRALEDNYDQIAKKDNYLKYIATRPRAQRVGSHGLFTGEEDQLVLAQVAEAVAAHPGNVWLPIISLRREDAARLGYDKAEEWKALLSKYAMEMAEAMKIPWEDFRWYAAFHDEAHHPHIHMVCYSADPSKGFLTTQGIAQIKSGLAKEIFRQELTELYQKQTQSMLVNNVSSDSELGIYLVNKGIIPFPDRFKPYINYARVGAEYREKHGGEYSSGNYVQKKTPELLENERLDGVFRIWMENPCPVRVQSETAQITLPATFEQLESARQLLGVDSLNMAKLTRVEALRPYLGEYLPLQGMDLRLEQLDELAENIRIYFLRRGAAQGSHQPV